MTDEPRTYSKRGYRAVNEVRAQDGERFIIRPVERRYASERVGIERLRCASVAREEGRRETALRREDCAETAWRIAERIEEK